MKSIIFLLINIFSKIIFHVRHPIKIHIILNDIYHHMVFLILNKDFTQSFRLLKNYSSDKQNEYNSEIIWIFWWQGINKLPNIVNACIRSIIHHSNGHKVILISKYNINKYVKLPMFIFNKLYSGKITLTHFSDILRFNLLDEYGGLWIDSTMYCVSDLKSNYFSDFYTSGPGGKNINMYHDFISDKWTGFLIGGYAGNPIFSFMKIFFNLYWSKNNRLIDYFLIDYALYYVYLHNIGDFAKYVNYISYRNNPNLHGLQSCLNSKFNINKYLKLCKNTDLFKLTYKMKFSNDKNTFYNTLINNK